MVSPVSAAVKAAHNASRRIRGESVTYTQGATSVTLQAVRGSTIWQAESIETGAVQTERSVDWLFSYTALVTSAGAAITPARGDTITDASGTIHRVMPFGDADQSWRWHNRDKDTLRVFSKERV